MKQYIEDAKARLDNRAWYERRVGPLSKINEDEYRFCCPIHGERNPSANFSVTKGTWFCHVCQKGGSPIDLLLLTGTPMKEAIAEVGQAAGLDEPPGRNGAPAQTARPAPRMDDARVVAWHEAALRNAELMDWFRDHRGYSQSTVVRWQLGWDGQRVTIPIRDERGILVNVRRYKRNAEPHDKIMSMAKGTGAGRLFPAEALGHDEIVIVEGEWDAILMHQEGFPNALTATAGAGTWKPEWTPLFERKQVAVIYDNDDPGRRGAQKVARALATVASVSIVTIPGLPEKGDVTDFFAVQGRDAAELRGLIADGEPFLLGLAQRPEDDPIPMSLHAASEAVNRGVRLAIPVMVSGKATTPYTIPNRFRVHCDMGNRKLCPICPLAEVAGERTLEVSARDPKVLQLINVSDDQQATTMIRLAGAVKSCTRPQVEIQSSTNVEELRLIPELDTTAEKGDSEYATRTGFYIGHGLRPNRSYQVVGYSHPHPRDQSTVHLLSEAIPAQDNISAFSMTDEVRDQLAVFRVDDGGVPARMDDIYDDMRLNVHRIQGRSDIQVAYDLAWHSAIQFYFNGAFVRRGWVEVMVFGDSGQGKSEMAVALLSHYRMGAKTNAEQASMAGLIGGLDKMGDHWILTWGRVPLNDKRLLIIDETQSLVNGQIEAMSEVRASGIAEVTKIRTERTNARCRLIWLANPSTGRPLAQYNQGVLAIKDIFHKPEDIRRLDVALGVATGDVDLADINVRHGTPPPPRYTSDACRLLILWAWSRTPDQVTFTDPATTAILAHATDFGRRYHASLPIVEPADQRLKLARLSVAVAARVFSSDETGERIVVTRDHVEFVAGWLHRIYSSRGMSYDEYSGVMRSGESLPPAERERLTGELMSLPGASSAMDFLRQAKVFRKSELEDNLGWTSEEAKATLKLLTSAKLIRSTRDGYVKQPVFIELLREIAGVGSPEKEADVEDAPWTR